MALFTPLTKTTLIVGVIMAMLSLSACETIPKPVTQSQAPVAQPSITQQSAHKTVTNKSATSQNNVTTKKVTANNVITEDDYVSDEDINSYPNEPYIIPKLPTASEPPIKPAPTTVPHPTPNITPPPVIPPSHSDLLERARQNSKNSKPQNAATASHPSNSPAFQKLMTTGINELKSDQLTAAENSFTRAQRLNPKSSAVYFYLSQVAFKKDQPRKAEAMARRGLSFTTDASQRQALWQLILRSGQRQNNARVIQEAQQALR